MIVAHVDGLAGQGSFDEDVRSAITGAADNVAQGSPDTESTLEAVVSFDERLDALVPARLRGAATMGRGSIEVAQTVNRMLVRSELAATGAVLLELVDSLLQTASAHVVTMLPMHAGGQPLQPTTFASIVGGTTGPLLRGVDLLNLALRQTNLSPMGAGSGTSSRFAPSREETSARLGFDHPIVNVYDAVSASDYLAVCAMALDVIASAVARLLAELRQIMWAVPDGIVFPDEQVRRLPDVPQMRTPDQLEAVSRLVMQIRQTMAGVRLMIDGQPPGPQSDNDLAVAAVIEGCVLTRELASTVAHLFNDGFEINRAALGNRAGKGHLTSSDIVDFLVIEEGISPGDARLIAERVLALVRDRGLEIAAIDREMIDSAGLLIVGHEIGIEFETLSKYLAPRRFLESRTSLGAPSPDSTRQWIRDERRNVQSRREHFSNLLAQWSSGHGAPGHRDDESVPESS
ncbi:MAG: lyase family protein [Thermomicrobiales bacterium]